MEKFESGQRVIFKKEAEKRFTFYVKVNDQKAIIKENDIYLREVNLSDIELATEEDLKPKYDTLSNLNLHANKGHDYFFLNIDNRKQFELGWYKGLSTDKDGNRHGLFVRFPDEYITVSEDDIEKYEVIKKRP